MKNIENNVWSELFYNTIDEDMWSRLFPIPFSLSIYHIPLHFIFICYIYTFIISYKYIDNRMYLKATTGYNT